MEIICTKYTSIPFATFLGYADFYLPEKGIEILSCTLHKKDKRRWLNLPSKSYMDGKEEKFRPIIRFKDPKEFREFCLLGKKEIDNFKESVVDVG